MSAIPRSARPAPVSADDVVRRYVDAVRREIDVDPLFRRRLRGAVMNQYVAQREGTAVAEQAPPRSEMGRLGRACLYASLVTAVSVGGVMAASEAAVPGDFLYPLKRSIEEMRMAVAPADLRDDLAAAALAERVDELARLIESGNTAAVTALADEIRKTYDALIAVTNGAALDDVALAEQLDRLDDTLAHAPVRARRAVDRAMNGAPGLETNAFDPVGPSEGSREPGPQGQGGGLLNGGGANEPPGQVDRTPPTQAPKPDPTPRPERSHGPSPTPSPELP
jgi:uncharacterized protein DUF5667